MAEALGIAAAALQFLGAAKTCLDVFQEFRQNTPETHRVLSFRLEAEALKFREWCEILGVQNMISASAANPDSWTDSHEMEAFRERLRQLLRFDNERVAGLTVHAMRDMEFTFRKARDKLAPVDNDTRTSYPTSPASPVIQKSSFTKLFRPHKDKTSQPSSGASIKRTSSSSLDLRSRASSVYIGVKWIALDKKSFKHLLDDITSINDCLNTFLSDEAKAMVKRRVQADILRHHQLEVASVEELPSYYREIQTLVAIKEEVQMEKDVDQKDADGTPHDTTKLQVRQPPIFEVSDFASGTLEFGPSRSISSLTGRPVLIEWTHYGKSINLDHFYRRGHLVRLLNSSDVFHKFKTLISCGMVLDSKNFRIGLVFQVPGELRAPIKERTLLELLDSTPRAIGQRFALARTLSTALHNIQSVSWVHKSIRSDNIVYFESQRCERPITPRPKGINGEVLATLGQARNGQRVSTDTRELDTPESALAAFKLPECYLLGWNLSRPDHAGELSENISASIQGYKLTREMIRLSSHPDLSQADKIGERPRYKLEYDIYAFGLVLLEIGLWKPLASLHKRCSSDDDFREKTAGVYCDMLLSNMGEIYWRATKRCLCIDFDLGTPESTPLGSSSEDEGLLLVAFERQVISQLEMCRA